MTPLEDGGILSFLLRRMNHAGHWTVSGVWRWGLWATVDEIAAGGSQSRDLEQGSEETWCCGAMWGREELHLTVFRMKHDLARPSLTPKWTMVTQEATKASKTGLLFSLERM